MSHLQLLFAALYVLALLMTMVIGCLHWRKMHQRVEQLEKLLTTHPLRSVEPQEELQELEQQRVIPPNGKPSTKYRSERRIDCKPIDQCNSAVLPTDAMTRSATAPAKHKIFLERVQTVIEENLDDSDFTVQDLATAVNYDRSQLLRKLRALVDQSPSSLLRSRRLERAGELLRAGPEQVSEVAYSVGFKSLAHFSNAFTEHFGQRPSAYAARHRSGAN